MGLLQRGRGQGWLAATADPILGLELLRRALGEDPRWDSQGEERSAYYATLALGLGLPAEELRPHSEEDYFRIEILQEMFRRGSAAAAPALQGFEKDDEDFWAEEEPSTLEAERELTDPVATVLARARSPFSPSLRERLLHIDAPEDVAALGAVARETRSPAFMSAVVVVAERGDESLVPFAEALLRTSPIGVTRAWPLRYLRALATPTPLRLARAWLGLDDARGDAALMILRDRAEAVDIPRLRQVLDGAEDYGTICDVVDAMHRVPEAVPYPELEIVYLRASYSYARSRAAAAMAATDPHFGASYAVECLWDCEPETRAIGATWAEPTARVLTRLRELADDEYEEPSVRAAAGRRLVEVSQT